MPKKVLMLIAHGFEEIEAITVIDVLRRAKIIVDIASINELNLAGAHCLEITADKKFYECSLQDYDAIVMPGGSSCAESLGKSAEVLSAVKKFNDEKKIIAAICASPAVVLAKNNFLKNIKATCYPSMKDHLPNYIDKKVVHDGNFITSQGPGTAFDFAFYLTSVLCDKKIEAQVKADMLA